MPESTVQRNAVDRYFAISDRGSTFGREIRGGFATFFTMAYILVLNPIILGSAEDKFGAHLSGPQLVTATALVAAVMTAIMGLGGNLPLAVAAGLGLNAVVAFQIAPLMSWPDAMGLIVIEGLLICVLVVTGLREAVMQAIPPALKQAISVGIGLFIAFIGFIDAGFATRIPGDTGSVPVQLGATGQLSGWPVLVFCLGVLLTVALLARKVKGAILISIVVMTAVAIVINEIADIVPAAWGLTVPSVPDDIVAAPDFGLVGSFSLFGAFQQTGVLTIVLLVFTLILSDFFDTMGTVVGISNEAGLLDEEGKVPNLGRVLLIDGAAAVAGGAASASSNTSYIESAAACRRGRPHRLRLPGHRRAVRRGPVPHPARHGRPGPGRRTRPDRRRLPADGTGPAHRLGAVRDRHPGLSHDRRDALHVLDHQRHRGGLPRLRRHQDRPRQGARGALAALGHLGTVRGVLRDRPDRAAARREVAAVAGRSGR